MPRRCHVNQRDADEGICVRALVVFRLEETETTARNPRPTRGIYLNPLRLEAPTSGNGRHVAPWDRQSGWLEQVGPESIDVEHSFIRGEPCPLRRRGDVPHLVYRHVGLNLADLPPFPECSSRPVFRRWPNAVQAACAGRLVFHQRIGHPVDPLDCYYETSISQLAQRANHRQPLCDSGPARISSAVPLKALPFSQKRNPAGGRKSRCR